MKFNYQARTKTGDMQSGVIEASSREVASNLLQKYGLYITFLEELEPKAIYKRKIKFFERISGKDIVIFTRQLTIMFQTKVSLIEALKVLAVQIKNKDFKEKILKMSEEVEGGASFSAALSLFPKIFSPFYISMAKSGESSGKLSESLTVLADHLERDYDLSSKLKGAMVYPAFLIFVAIIVVILMITFVIPRLTEVFLESGAELPLLTRILVSLSDFFRSSAGLIFLIITVLFIFFIFRYLKTQKGKEIFERVSIRLPVIGYFLKMIYLCRFAENLSTLVEGGIPIAKSLEVSGEIVNNSLYREVIFKARDGVRRGETIASILNNYPELFPAVFNQMVMVGEKTGTLSSTLLQIMNFYQKEVERTTASIMSLLEPVLIVFLGLIVAGLMAAILIPLYQMASLL